MDNHNIGELQHMVEEEQVVELVGHTTSSTTSNHCIYPIVSSL